MAERGRTSIELGSVVVAAVAIFGLVFQAGTLWAKLDSLADRTTKLEAQSADVPQRLAKIEQLVQDLHDNAQPKR